MKDADKKFLYLGFFFLIAFSILFTWNISTGKAFTIDGLLLSTLFTFMTLSAGIYLIYQHHFNLKVTN